MTWIFFFFFFFEGGGVRGGGLPRVVLGGYCRKPSQCHHHKVFSALSIQPYSTRRKQASLSHTYYVTKIPAVYIKFARTDKTPQCNRVAFDDELMLNVLRCHLTY